MMEIPLIQRSILHFDKSSGHLKKRIAVIGSTGSIGTQVLEVIRQNQDKFTAEILTAHSNFNLLINQAIEFLPNAVVIGNEDYYRKVADALSAYPVKVFAGESSVSQIVEMDTIDLVVNALVGYSGLKPTLTAINAGKDIALANKESLVVAGDLVMKKAREKGVMIIPVDSEHSAIFQCMAGESLKSVEKVWLTASGGPFRGKTRHQLRRVTKEAALNHPNWKMGNKITIDSASLMNKGLEVIEAKWLFSLQPDQIEVIIHPQSIVHSMVQFIDGSMKAQLGLPDMKLPVLFALGFPSRVLSDFPRFCFGDFTELTFEQPDREIFRNLGFAYEALSHGGNMPCVLNAANEIAVNAFLEDRISFLDMSVVIEHCLKNIAHIPSPVYEDYVHTHEETQQKANEYIKQI
jgi:1-deoxy-D-xylulose-5-phosphate reductoisomerase